ncbi:MAG: hypothetical protein KKG76_13960 [Euryarchaeota archaeon]|nr:hypothetical protein [Euryarchaeota archaeon]
MEQGATYEVLLSFRRAIQQNDTLPGRYTGKGRTRGAGVSPPDDSLLYGWAFAQRQELIGRMGFIS